MISSLEGSRYFPRISDYMANVKRARSFAAKKKPAPKAMVKLIRKVANDAIHRSVEDKIASVDFPLTSLTTPPMLLGTSCVCFPTLSKVLTKVIALVTRLRFVISQLWAT